MVSKTHKQKQKKKEKLRENGGVMPAVVPSVPKSVHLKKTRPRMKGKKKIRLGLECPVDIYEGFEDKKGVSWACPRCGKVCRVVGFCVDCVTGVKSRKHGGGVLASSTASAASSSTKRAAAGSVKKSTARVSAAVKKKLKSRKG